LALLGSDGKKPDEKNSRLDVIERELASLYPAMIADKPAALKILTRKEFNENSVRSGYLYNHRFDHYVTVDSKNELLYADGNDPAKAVFWTMSKNKDWDAYGLRLQTFRNQTNYWFNWRNITGACKLYESYDPILIYWMSENDTLFQLQVPSQSDEFVGTWEIDDSELYIRHNNACRDWKFVYIDFSMLDKEENMILQCYSRLRCN
jgi:hypothetical protein